MADEYTLEAPLLASSRQRARQLIGGVLERVIPGDRVTISCASSIACTLSFADEIILGVLVENPGVTLRVTDMDLEILGFLRARAEFHGVADRLTIQVSNGW